MSDTTPSGRPRSRMRVVRIIRARPRLFLSALLGLAVFALVYLAFEWRIATKFLVGWDAGVIFYLVFVASLAARSDGHRIRRRAVDRFPCRSWTPPAAVLHGKTSGISMICDVRWDACRQTGNPRDRKVPGGSVSSWKDSWSARDRTKRFSDGSSHAPPRGSPGGTGRRLAVLPNPTSNSLTGCGLRGGKCPSPGPLTPV